MASLEWDHDGREVVLARDIIFGKGYDFFGLEMLRQEAKGSRGNYLIWPDRVLTKKVWNLYRDSDGMFQQNIETEDMVKKIAEEWDSE